MVEQRSEAWLLGASLDRPWSLKTPVSPGKLYNPSWIDVGGGQRKCAFSSGRDGGQSARVIRAIINGAPACLSDEQNQNQRKSDEHDPD